jgi:hypothetical protein
MEWIVKFKLKRDMVNLLHDSSYSTEDIKNEITSWLDDLDFTVKELEVKEKV